MVPNLLSGGVVATAGAADVALQTSSDNTLGLLALFGLGLFLVYNGFGRWKQMRLIQDTPTEKVRSAAVGRTELSGTATPIDGVGTIDEPFTDGECLLAVYRIEEWEEDHDDDDHGRDGRWETIDSGALLTPFEINDGTGAMRVEPEESATLEISDDHRTEFRVGAHRQPPDEIVEFFGRRYDDDDDDGLLGRIFDAGPGTRGSDRRRFTQEVIPPGEQVYALGAARPIDGASGSNADRLVLERDEGSDQFIISDKSEEELVSDYWWAAPVQIFGGIALSAGILYITLT